MHRDIHDLDPTRAPSVFDVDVLRIAKVYAHALLNVAIKNGHVDDYQEAFDTLVGNPLQEPTQSDIGPLLTSTMISHERKEEIIKKVFDPRVDQTFVNFLLVLNKHDRLGLLRPIAAMYRQLRDEHHRRVRTLVRSAVALTDEQRQQVKEMVQNHFHQQAVLVEEIDPDLLGGLQLRIGDLMIDLSLRSRLFNIQQQMIERSKHEIQRRRDRVGSAS
jgi:F-type H+-transporting ATPase subunit delta